MPQTMPVTFDADRIAELRRKALAEAVRKGDACCMQAELILCVCRCAARCPVHGENHKGTHD